MDVCTWVRVTCFCIYTWRNIRIGDGVMSEKTIKTDKGIMSYIAKLSYEAEGVKPTEKQIKDWVDASRRNFDAFMNLLR